MKEMKWPVIISVCMAGIIYYATQDTPRQPRVQGCYGECYEEYKRVHGSVVDELRIQQLAAAEDPFSSIRGLWSGCAACHGSNGAGGIGPAIAGRDIADMLKAYRAKETRGPQSVMMWGQASQLSDQEIELLSKFTKEEL
ncbi:c-type cytochrome [Phenylobacterium sp.]|uniref:c-type cytochrome n=1 Tax=Phenylobacterium sp. TaxID=1871053 RepID=UPI0025DB3978|nr:c-type cytochrome [Phenylobacterium sp.]